MKLIESSYKILPQEPGLDGIYKMCEIAGRTAYKSEDRITEGSAKKFVDALIRLNHGAVLEHGTVYLMIPYDISTCGTKPFHKYNKNPYSRVNTGEGGDINYAYITTNLRVLMENE